MGRLRYTAWDPRVIVRKGVVQVKVVVGGNCELAYGTRHPAPTKRGLPVRVFRACACAIYRGP
jgi:hypothetical protein